jgi:hypothetical protein
MLEFMYTCFELRDGIFEHLCACSILAIRVFTVVWAIGASAWATYWTDAIAFLEGERRVSEKLQETLRGK